MTLRLNPLSVVKGYSKLILVYNLDNIASCDFLSVKYNYSIPVR
jgi:hypothetical protein